MGDAMNTDKEIVFFDETTINNWAANPRVWMDPRDPIVRMMPQVRMSITILGGICYKTGRVHYELGTKTDTKNVHRSLKKIIPKAQNNDELVLFLDRHTAHRSPTVKKYLERKNVEYHYLPPNTSQISPIENFWGAFKMRFRRKQLNKMNWTYDQFKAEVIKTLGEVQGADNMVKGAGLGHMIKIIKQDPKKISKCI